MASLESGEFGRLRVGIGRPPAEQDAVEHVLEGFQAEERPRFDASLARAEEAVLLWMELGIEAAMNRFNAA